LPVKEGRPQDLLDELTNRRKETSALSNFPTAHLNDLLGSNAASHLLELNESSLAYLGDLMLGSRPDALIFNRKDGKLFY
jgi:hypothetical protein